MNVDQDIVRQVVEQIGDGCDSLRRLFGLPTRIEISNNSSRATYDCKIAGCTYVAYEADDLQAHLEIDHGLPRADQSVYEGASS